MRSRFLLGLSFCFVLSAAAVPACVIHEHSDDAVVDREPPPDRDEAQSASPGGEHVWIRGHWRWDGHEYVWVAGHWERRPRAGAEWVHGHWARRGGGWVWVEGHWT